MNYFILIPLSIGMGLAGLAAFVWALRSGQFDDPDGDACRVLNPQSQSEGEDDDKLASQSDHRNPGRGL
jgi:cbb3-type cytochrome oxidase maturation protein